MRLNTTAIEQIFGGLGESLLSGSQVKNETLGEKIEGVTGSLLNDAGFIVSMIPGAGKLVGNAMMVAGSGLLAAQLRSEEKGGLITKTQEI